MKILLFILFNKFLMQQRLEGIKTVNTHSYILFFWLILLLGGPLRLGNTSPFNLNWQFIPNLLGGGYTSFAIFALYTMYHAETA